MTDKIRKSQGSLLPLGAAFAVTAALPLTSVTAEAATSVEKLSALRAAASAGQIELVGTTADKRPMHERLMGGFDNRAPEAPDDDSDPRAPDLPDTGTV